MVKEKKISIYEEILALIFCAALLSVVFGLGGYFFCKNRGIQVGIEEDYSESRKNCDSRIMSLVREFDKNLLDIMQGRAEFIDEDEYSEDYWTGEKIYWGDPMSRWLEESEDPFRQQEPENQGICITVINYMGDIVWKDGEKSNDFEAVDVNTLWQQTYYEDSSEYRFVYTETFNGYRYYLLFEMPLQPELVYHYEKIQIASILAAIALFFVLLLLGVRGKIRYVVYLSEVVEGISKGNLSTQVQIRGKDELAMVAVSIDEMQRSLSEKIAAEQRSERRVRDLITNMAHDVKTPITIISGYLDVVRQEKYEDGLQQKAYLDKVYEQVLKMNKMIQHIFLLAREGAAKESVETERIHFSRLLKQEIAEYETLANERGLKITTDICAETVYLMWNVEQMKVVLDNIFVNAVKYSAKKATIAVCLLNEEKTVLFSVSNASAPLKKEELSEIFEKFYRADKARNSAVEGNGLGLSMVKEIVGQYNGKVWAEYRSGTFTINVRLQKEQKKE